MAGVSASVIFRCTIKSRRSLFFSGTGPSGWSQKKGRKTVVRVCVLQPVTEFENWFRFDGVTMTRLIVDVFLPLAQSICRSYFFWKNIA